MANSKRLLCTRCCQPIVKSGLRDPYLCRECEKALTDEQDRFACLDRGMGAG